MPETWTVTKEQVEQYWIRGPGFAWAIVTLDPRGIFQAVSGFGTYAYSGWGHHGCASFKHFLVGLTEADYFISKVCGHDEGGPGRAGKIFSHDRTEKNIRRSVIEARRGGDLSKENARACWDEIEDELPSTDDEREFIEEFARRCSNAFRHLFDRDYCDLSDACCHELAPGPLRFFEEIFRGQLVPALQAEIAAEEAAAAQEVARAP